MFSRLVLGFLNHLLEAEPWARSRLQAFSGNQARFECGPFITFVVTVDATGMLEVADPLTEVHVTIRLPDDAPLRFLIDRSSLLTTARISGSADFAEALGFVARNLRWDAEADLANLLGDVTARRLNLASQDFFSSKILAGERLLLNIFEFLADEERVVLRPDPVRRYCIDVDRIRDDLARMEKRLERLSAV